MSWKCWQSSAAESEESLLGDALSPSTRPLSDPSVFPTVKKVGFRDLLGAVWVVTGAFFKDEVAGFRARLMAGSLVVMMIFFAFINLWFLEMFREFQNALHDKDADKFKQGIYKICIVALSLMPVTALRDALKGALALEWRRYLTTMLLQMYISDSQAYYRLKLYGCGVDNPDQRIAQDTGEFTHALLAFLTNMVQAVIVILTQSGLLISISHQLFGCILLYSLLMNVLTFNVFGGRLTEVSRSVLAQEASLRFGLVRVREHAEPIAFYQGASFEKARCMEFFSELMNTLYHKLCLLVTFESLQHTMGLFVSVLPYMVVAGKYLAGEMDFGAMSMAAAVLGALERSFNSMVSQMEKVTSMGAQAFRLRQIWDVLSHINEIHYGKEQDTEGLLLHGGELGTRGVSLSELSVAASGRGSPLLMLRLDDLTLQPPVGQVPLVHGLSLELRSGESLLVCGPSGIGKSSLLRAIGGLWASGRGTIERCPTSQCFFVPQEPYLCLGSLRENATYPGLAAGARGTGAEPTDGDIRAALAEVNIGYLLERFGLDEQVHLDSVLSGGERQRLGFARLLLRPPTLRFAILDEATSALDEANENIVYHLLKSRVLSYVSVGHRASLEAFHTHKLLMDRTSQGGCSWRIVARREVALGRGAAGGRELPELEPAAAGHRGPQAEEVRVGEPLDLNVDSAEHPLADRWSPL